MKVLSLRPWMAWAVLHGGKTVENRSWSTSYRGPLAIHASGNKESDSQVRRYLEAVWCMAYGKTEAAHRLATMPTRPVCGAIIGVVDLVKISETSRSPWSDDLSEYYWIFANPRAVTPHPCLGKLRLWECPDEWIKT